MKRNYTREELRMKLKTGVEYSASEIHAIVLFDESTYLVDDLHLDSLDLIQLVIWIEDEFWISITDEDYEKWQTVGDVIDFLTKILK